MLALCYFVEWKKPDDVFFSIYVYYYDSIASPLVSHDGSLDYVKWYFVYVEQIVFLADYFHQVATPVPVM
jgi:hypothetical protein